MKRIDAIIKPFKFEDVKEALYEVGVQNLTFFEVRGSAKNENTIYRGSEYVVEFVPRVMIVIFVPDEQETTVVEAIARAANTGKIGDGKIAVTPVDQILRIRTGERGDDAI